MSSRAEILNTVAKNKPALVPLPTIDFNQLISFEDLASQFQFSLEKIGGEVILFPNEESLFESIRLQENQNRIINTLQMNDAEKLLLNREYASTLENVHTAYFRGEIAVAENGAVWIDETAMVNRVLPMICEHLVLVLDKNAIVATMHHAYEKVNVKAVGYGAFIAGPSKTADIEQSLVIGAHGPRSLKVCLIG